LLIITDDYIEAKKLEKKAENTSNLESSDVGEQRKRKPVPNSKYSAAKAHKNQKRARCESSDSDGDTDSSSSLSDVSIPEGLTVTSTGMPLVISDINL